MAELEKAKKLILVVDDEQPLLEMLKMILNLKGYKVATDLDGTALKKIPQLKPDLILLDLMMPGTNTIEASQNLKADPATSHIPIILMTGGAAGTAKHATHLDDVIFKPFDLDQLLYTIRRLI